MNRSTSCRLLVSARCFLRPPSLRPLALGLLSLASAAQGAPLADFTTDPFNLNTDGPLVVQFIDSSVGDISAWSWNFGDGSGSGEQNPLHEFFFGTHDVSLTVTGPGGSDTLVRVELIEITLPPPAALDTVPVFMPADLLTVVADMDRAIELGKALFWDVQVGSDGLTACASCHYHAGVDNRPRNTLNPGANGAFDATLSGRGGGPNTTLNAGDFPFTKWFDPHDGLEPVGRTDDVRGATGVTKTLFQGLGAGAVDAGLDLDDDLFQVGGADTLQTTGRDAPTVIGAVYFHRVFLDGRANHFFNGKNIWGNADPAPPAVLEMLPDGSLGDVALLLNNAALASQAIGPPLSGVEMSWAGRGWPDLGRKMLPLMPLASQVVHPADGVLGGLALDPGPGLNAGLRYGDMIRAAFLERWWGSAQLTPEGFTQMEANFSLFFGLAVQLYEATLIPDQAPFDQFMSGDPSALGDSEKRGLSFFLGRGRCIACHATPVFAGAMSHIIINPVPEPGPPEPPEGLIERMTMNNWLALASMTFASLPEANELSINFNPYRRTVRIIAPDGRLAAGTATLPAGQACPEARLEVYPLQPAAWLEANAEFLGDVRIENDGNCNFRITVAVEWGAFGPPGGSYILLIGNKSFPFVIPQATPQAVYDNGFYNIGVTPTPEDLGAGAEGPFGPLSITRRVQRGDDIGQDPGVFPVLLDERTAVNGAFKTPTLRNIQLTGPYMHNGSMATLEQVVEFYARATDFGVQNRHDLAPEVFGFDITEQEKADLVAFLEALTDPRVLHERAPFDHPELPLKAGHTGDHQVVVSDGAGNAVLDIELIPATGAAGGPAIPAFIDRLEASVSVALADLRVSSARIGFICDKRPASDILISLSLSDPSVATLSVAQIAFTPGDFRMTRFVDVLSVGAGGPVTLVTSTVSALDPEFSGLAVRDVLVELAGGGAVAPTAGFTMDRSAGNVPLPVQFTDTTGGDVTSWSWAFGDGALSSLQNPSHTYTSGGTFTVTLTATGPGGSDVFLGPDSIVANVAGAMNVDFVSNRRSGVAPLRVRFRAFNLSGRALTGTFDFGDGATAGVGLGTARVVHTFTAPGLHTITLTASNNTDTAIEQKVAYITVSAP